jgi:anhydro-N-acetylmuramic acid kinase
MDKEKMDNLLNSPLTVIGLMSGTSADGIDAALLETDGETITHFGHNYHKPYPELLKTMILQAYGRVPGPEAALLEKIITEQHAQAVETLLERSGYKASEIDLIGFHGQTLFHQPPQIRGEKGQTHIIGDGALLSSLTGITVVDQFRLNDIAEGGQGAPLVPIFHKALAKDLPKPLAFLNIGGVANVTWLGENDEDIIAFDTGPGNGLIDDWVRTYCSLPWDEDGKIAAKGTVHSDILRSWLFHPYLSQKPPKALDRKQFSKCLEDVNEIPFEDAIATLTAFTVRAIEKALPFFPEKPKLWLVGGGGAHNVTLLNMMRERLEVDVKRVTDVGLDGDALEAQAFGFLAVRSMRNYPLTFPGTTGVPYPLPGGRICKSEKTLTI